MFTSYFEKQCLSNIFVEAMIEEDRILQAMPNIVMALHILCEKMSVDSFLETLPQYPSACYSWPLGSGPPTN